MNESEETFKWYQENIAPEIDKLQDKVLAYNKQRKIDGKKSGVLLDVHGGI